MGGGREEWWGWGEGRRSGGKRSGRRGKWWEGEGRRSGGRRSSGADTWLADSTREANTCLEYYRASFLGVECAALYILHPDHVSNGAICLKGHTLLLVHQ